MAQRRKKDESVASAVGGGGAATPSPLMSKFSNAVEKIVKVKAVSKFQKHFDAVSTGSFIVDQTIGGVHASDGHPACLGFPRRRISEVAGAEGSGKTTLLLAALAKLAREGGTGVFLDFEQAMSHEYAYSCGADFSLPSIKLYQPANLEEGLKILGLAIKLGVDLVAVDSLSAMVPQKEMEKQLDAPAKVGALAASMSTQMPKLATFLNQWNPEGRGTALVFLNQKRALISTTPSYGGPSETTSGGKAPKFYFSLRLDLARIQTESVEVVDPLSGKKKKRSVGNVVGARLVKTKLAANLNTSGNFFIRYGQGVDDAFSLMATAEVHGIVERKGATYTYNGESVAGKESFRKHLCEHPELMNTLREAVTKAILETAPRAMTEEDAELEDLTSSVSIFSGGEDGEEADPDAPADLDLEDEATPGDDAE